MSIDEASSFIGEVLAKKMKGSLDCLVESFEVSNKGDENE